MLDSFLASVGELFQNAVIPFQVMEVYRLLHEIWGAFPFVVQVTLTACFAVACLFAIIRMVFLS